MNNTMMLAIPYPHHAFHMMARKAAIEISTNTQAPDALICMEILSNMSVSAQGLYDVKLPLGKISPVSLNCMIIAESGERMSGVHAIVAKPLYDFDKEQMSKYQEKMAHYEDEMCAWEVVNQGLSRKLAKSAEKGDWIDEDKENVIAWAKQRPLKPRARRIMRQNISDRALMDALQGEGESVAFMSDEGELIIKGGALNSMGTMNKAWDGADMLALDRGNGVSVVAHQPRVTVAFKAQPQVLKKLLYQRGDVMRGSGHWARYLVGSPASTQGMRFSDQLEKDWIHVGAFHDRMRELLNDFGEQLNTGVIQRKILEFSSEAKEEWVRASNFIEERLGPMGYLHDVKDFASKTMEIMGRVAALMHIYAKQEGQITLDTVQRALTIMQWHVEEFKRLFSPEVSVAQAQLDAQTLVQYLQRHKLLTGSNLFSKNYILQNGPIRPCMRLNDALDRLVMANQVQIQVGRRKQRFVMLNF